MLIQAFAEWWRHIATTYSHMEIELIGTLIVQLTAFYVPCLIYMSLPTIAPQFSERHKLQKQEKQPTSDQVWDALFVVARNQFMGVVLQYSLLALSNWRGDEKRLLITPELPALHIFIRDLFISLIVREALFYYSHRLFHMKRLYPYIHKIHHRFTAPIALSAQYAHPVEHLIANILPIVLPCMLLQTHILTFWVFLTAMLLETSTVHSGYDFWPNLAEKHDRHHEVFIWNFGACIDWFDILHGTKEHRKSKANGSETSEKKKN